MCTEAVRKEANRLNWMIKGQLIDRTESDAVVEQIYDSYFKRLWGNNESYIHEEGFDRAYEARKLEILREEISTVAVLGYD